MIIANYDVKYILIDSESSIDVLFYDEFQKIKLFDDRLKRVNTPLIRISRNSIMVLREIILPVIAKQKPKQMTI